MQENTRLTSKKLARDQGHMHARHTGYILHYRKVIHICAVMQVHVRYHQIKSYMCMHVTKLCTKIKCMAISYANVFIITIIEAKANTAMYDLSN